MHCISQKKFIFLLELNAVLLTRFRQAILVISIIAGVMHAKNRIRLAIDGKSSGFSICGIVFPSLSSSFPSFGNVDLFLGMSKFFKFFKRQPHRRMSITCSRIYRLEAFERLIQEDGHVFLDCKRANAARSVPDELFHNV